ncbi:MAG: metallophosphoesterase [Parvularcula sp.]|jgi:hypothetical protein|nr:metallophosphoesterase [Parvularcula sp.]
MRIAILSDLHAFCSDARKNSDGRKGPAPSLIDISAPSRTKSSDPLIGFTKLFENGEIDFPDLFIVAGDLGDKADTLAMRTVWNELVQLAASQADVLLLATCGNHDLDTRYQQNSFDPRGYLRTLNQNFPYPAANKYEINQLEYWATNFSILEHEAYRILNINSCAFHGFGSDAEPELEHGRISDITLGEIEERLRLSVQQDPNKHNICLFHHHITPVSSDVFDDRSVMKGAERLTSMLSRAALGEWFIIHGHRHRSNLFHAGGNSGPIVLSCASFAATRTGDEHNPTPNQFYILQFDVPQSGKAARVSGSIEVWNWTPSIGWQSSASIPGGLPVETGFGFRGYIPDLADKIAADVRANMRLERSRLLCAFPEVGRLIPTDIDSLIATLENQGLVVTQINGRITEVVVANA